MVSVVHVQIPLGCAAQDASPRGYQLYSISNFGVVCMLVGSWPYSPTTVLMATTNNSKTRQVKEIVRATLRPVPPRCLN